MLDLGSLNDNALVFSPLRNSAESALYFGAFNSAGLGRGGCGGLTQVHKARYSDVCSQLCPWSHGFSISDERA